MQTTFFGKNSSWCPAPIFQQTEHIHRNIYSIEITAIKFIFMFAEDLKGLFSVEYSEEGSTARVKEVDAYVHFADFLDECSGKLLGQGINIIKEYVCP